MTPDAYRRFTERLRESLESNLDVLGFVALGSMADTADTFSDHDFFVIVPSGKQEQFRSDLTWLPDSERIAFTYRETAHGVKAVYDDGHLLEFAVFDPEEIALARVNRYRVLFDREKVGSRMQAARASTDAMPARDTSWLIGQFLTQLLVGVCRFRRGERLSGHKLVRVMALESLLTLAALHLPRADVEAPDNLDPFRRVERAWPELARAIEEAIAKPVPLAAQQLLELAVLSFRIPADGIAAIRRVVGGITAP